MFIYVVLFNLDQFPCMCHCYSRVRALQNVFFPGVLIILSVGLLMIGFCVWLAMASTCGAALGPSVLEAYDICLPFLGGESFDHPARTSSNVSIVELVLFFHCNRFYFIVHLICGETLSSQTSALLLIRVLDLAFIDDFSLSHLSHNDSKAGLFWNQCSFSVISPQQAFCHQ